MKKVLVETAAILLLVLSSRAFASTDTSAYATLPTGTGGCGEWTCGGTANEKDALGVQGDGLSIYHNADTQGASLEVYGFNFSTIPSGSFINSVKVSYYAKKSTSGGIPQWINARIGVGGNYVTSANQTTTIAWVEYYWTSTTRPGGGAWTWDDVQNLQLSFSVPGGGDAGINQQVDRAYLTVNWQPIGLADRTYPLCDPYASKFCSGLVALYEFEEAADYDRTSETGSARLLEPDGADVAQGTSCLRNNCLSHTATANSYLYIPRTVGLSGTFTINLWIKLTTLPSADGKSVYILSMRNFAGSGDYPMLYLYRTGGSTYVLYSVKQAINDLPGTVTGSPAVSADGLWHQVTFGQYPTPTTTEPYQYTLWMSIDGQAKTTTTVTYPGVPALGDLIIGGWNNTSPLEYGAYYLDQLGLWSWVWSPGDVTLMYNSRTGRAYPFSGF